MELAGDKLTVREISAAHKLATGATMRPLPVPVWLTEPISPQLIATARWLQRRAFAAELHYLRQQHPNLMSLERWFRTWMAGASARPEIQLTL